MIYPPLRPRSEAVLHTDERIAVRHEFHTCRPGGARGTALHEEVDPRSPWTRTRSLDSPQPAKLDVQIGCMPMLGIMNGWCYLVRILPSHPSKKIKVGLKVYYHVHQLPDVMLCQSAGERWISKVSSLSRILSSWQGLHPGILSNSYSRGFYQTTIIRLFFVRRIGYNYGHICSRRTSEILWLLDATGSWRSLRTAFSRLLDGVTLAGF
ncbi:uncharacterized protein [Lolium perenne]|uniref:uncharacterized protein isoform X1 n=1 Tax=Lolium perenne TaxID=4522 RepID=UPI0021F670FE|nr:uncharacterized protein LOC127301566 isoform X1 [Lolium perenne]